MRRPALLLFALAVFLWFAPSARVTAATVQLSDASDTVYLYPGTALDLIEDPAGALTIDQVARSSAWEPMRPLTNQHSVYWLRLKYSTAGTTKHWQLFLGFKPLTVEQYVKNADGTFAMSRSGTAVAYADRPVKKPGPIILYLPDAPQGGTVYLRMTTREPEVTIAIDSAQRMADVSQTTFAIIIGLDSIILSLILSCIVYYLTSRDTAFLWYLVYLTSELIYRTNDQGIAAAWLWPHWNFSALTLDALLEGVRIVAATLFLRAFLNLPRVSPWLDRINIGFAAIFAIFAIVCFMGGPVHISILDELPLVYVPLWLISSLIAWRRGEKQALLIAVGWSLLMIFSVSFGLKQLGFLRGNIIGELIISQGRNFGVGLQTLFLSLAISTDLSRVMRSRQYYASLAANDALTGLANRRTFEETLNRELGRMTRKSEHLSLLVYDVDLFKTFNDTRGHAEGDTLLRIVSQLAMNVLRGTDVLCRYGGDEFVAILPDANDAIAARIAERICAAVSDRALPNPGAPSGIVTLSIGIATTSTNESLGAGELFNRADRALLEAKKRGRNNYVAASALTTA